MFANRILVNDLRFSVIVLSTISLCNSLSCSSTKNISETKDKIPKSEIVNKKDEKVDQTKVLLFIEIFIFEFLRSLFYIFIFFKYNKVLFTKLGASNKVFNNIPNITKKNIIPAVLFDILFTILSYNSIIKSGKSKVSFYKNKLKSTVFSLLQLITSSTCASVVCITIFSHIYSPIATTFVYFISLIISAVIFTIIFSFLEAILTYTVIQKYNEKSSSTKKQYN